MARDNVAVLKRCRSLGLDPVYLGSDKKSKKVSQKTGRKMSEYGLQMREKQKAKFIYGVLEKQFRGYYAKAEKMAKKEGVPGENLLVLLELRLDNVLYRLGYGRTRKEARQICRHKHILVNGKAVDIPSYQVKVGDVVEIREKYKSIQRYKNVLDVTGSRIVPEWLSANHDALSGTVIAKPQREQIDVPVEETFIVELYSK